MLPHELIRFAHNSERQFAKLLDFYGIVWEYEPRTFTLERDRDGRPVQAFTPDFYLPAYDLYIEITTLNQKLVTKKNRKARRLVEQHPDVSIRVLYQRDYLHLLVKYGLEPPSQLVDAGLDADAPRTRPCPSTSGAGRDRRARFRGRERVSASERRAAAQSARRAAPGARRADGAVRRLGHAAAVHERARRAPRVPHARGRVRRVAPGHGRVRAAPGALELLQWLLTNDLRKIEPGRAQYTHLLDPDDAHVVDDIIVWWVDVDRFFVMPNASNTDDLLAAFDEG